MILCQIEYDKILQRGHQYDMFLLKAAALIRHNPASILRALHQFLAAQVLIQYIHGTGLKYLVRAVFRHFLLRHTEEGCHILKVKSLQTHLEQTVIVDFLSFKSNFLHTFFTD